MAWVLVLCFLIFALTPVYIVSGISRPTQIEQPYPSGSWALGVVVPENAQFADGGRLSWENVTAVTAVVQLPNITSTDAPILAVESIMALDGSVLQVAAGIYPNSTRWYAYGWYIGNPKAYPQTYAWILNSSRPEMTPGSSISLSMYFSSGHWHYAIEEMRTKEITIGEYAFNVPSEVKSGDQEIIALESYSTSDGVFAHMGNMTLNTLNINKRKVADGWYPYGSWDTTHKPLFVVGGLTPPGYISLQQVEGGSLDWSYQELVNPVTLPSPVSFPQLVISALASIVIVLGVVAYSQLGARHLHQTSGHASTGSEHRSYSLRKTYTLILYENSSTYHAT
jgi:hypothetical protein